MGYSISYSLVRERPLTGSERLRLARHAVAWAGKDWPGERYQLRIVKERRPDGLLAWGSIKPESYDGEDTQQLFEALIELRALIEGAHLSVEDDIQSVGWNPASGAYELDPELHVDGPELDRGGSFFSPADLIEPYGLEDVLGKALASAVSRVVFGEPADTALLSRAPSIKKLLGAFAKLENNEAALRAIETALDACDPIVVSSLGIRAPKTHHKLSYYLGRVLERVENADALVEPFLERWRKRPKSKYHWADLLFAFPNDLLGRVGAHDEVQAELFSTLDELLGDGEFDHDERTYRKLEQSICLLGMSRTQSAATRLVALARRDRERFDEGDRWIRHGYFYNVKIPIIDALGSMAFPGTFATLVLDLAHQKGPYFGHKGIVHGLCHVDPERGLPVLAQLVDLGIWTNVIDTALARVSHPAATDLLSKLSSYPLAEVREAAARGLTKQGHSSPPPPPLTPWYERVTHLDGMVRRAAFEEVARHRRKSDVLALAAAEELDHELNRALGGTSTVMWSDPPEFMPKDAAAHLAKRITWAREFAASRDDQVVPGPLARVVEEGAAAVVATYPAQRFTLSDELRESLLAEERAVWGDSGLPSIAPPNHSP